jgi:hypothetical protein
VMYPFVNEKYGHAQFGWGGGMEHQTMSFVGGFGNSLLAHECAHQWFGDMISCKGWDEIWLNEGFATYFAAIYDEKYYPERFELWKSAAVNNITSAAEGTVHCNDTTSVQRIFDGRLSYRKGAYLLHMLRFTLGDSVFFSGLKSYCADTSIRYSYATTEDLKRNMEAISGKDLTRFFYEWYSSDGYPQFRIEWENNNSEVVFSLTQSSTSGTVPYFQTKVPVQFIGVSTDTIIVIDPVFNGQTFSINLPFTVIQIAIDPRHEIISANNQVFQKSAISGEAIEVYPVPFNDMLFVNSTRADNRILSLRFYSVTGKLLFEREGISEQTSVISFQELASGNYLLEVLTGEGTLRKKVSVSRR